MTAASGRVREGLIRGVVSGSEGDARAAALVVAVENWGRNGCAGDLGERVAAGLNLVRTGLAPLA